MHTGIIFIYVSSRMHGHHPERVYEFIESRTVEYSKKYIIFIQRDWSINVGACAYRNWSGIVGRFGISETNLDFMSLMKSLPHCNPISCHEPPPGNSVARLLHFVPAVLQVQPQQSETKDVHQRSGQTSNWNWKLNFALRTPDNMPDPEVAEGIQAQFGSRFACFNPLADR